MTALASRFPFVPNTGDKERSGAATLQLRATDKVGLAKYMRNSQDELARLANESAIQKTLKSYDIAKEIVMIERSTKMHSPAGSPSRKSRHRVYRSYGNDEKPESNTTSLA
ncbi:hypothetical protein PFICI_02671 [Pestalotiopsis fici W106-1]|uniref:Uncharacterized protein n=1 Tax=Pestalotiopsis fici (strain W106-1 / CGMCC3.15140) TaxID=1229662 RepID=W3XHE5_PESFW|nr:uncharacterized protein PFICI_02671 [Pestalotiopsis fici W106-1]ETS84646.1 hypothetical protein PFICI_02671 [Pestalotiopsis fici W106-1]